MLDLKNQRVFQESAIRSTADKNERRRTIFVVGKGELEGVGIRGGGWDLRRLDRLAVGGGFFLMDPPPGAMEVLNMGRGTFD